MLLLFFQYKNTKRTENESLHRKTEREREVDASLRVRERANSLSLSLFQIFSLCQRERARPAFSSLVSLPAAAQRANFFFFCGGSGGAFLAPIFFASLSLSLSSQKISLRSYYFITQRLCAEQKAPALPHPLAPQNFTHIYNAYTYIKTKMAKVSFSRLCEQNTKREREWRIKYRASRVSSPFRSRARADFFVFFFSRASSAVVDFSLRKTARERWMRTSLARLDDSNVSIYRGWMDSDRICAFSLLSSVSFGEMHFTFFPFRCRFRFADRALVGSADLRFTFAALVSTQSRSFTIIKIANVVFFPFYASISTERSKESQIWDPVLLPGG